MIDYMLKAPEVIGEVIKGALNLIGFQNRLFQSFL